MIFDPRDYDFHPDDCPHRAHWPIRYLEMACGDVASWSKDPSTGCGCVIVNDKKRLKSLGFNGFPEGVEDRPEWYADRATKYPMMVHAEANALDNAEVSVRGMAMFVSKHPCAPCALRIASRKIGEVHYQIAVSPADVAFEQRWGDDIAQARLTLGRAGIPLIGWDIFDVYPGWRRIANHPEASQVVFKR